MRSGWILPLDRVDPVSSPALDRMAPKEPFSLPDRSWHVGLLAFEHDLVFNIGLRQSAYPYAPGMIAASPGRAIAAVVHMNGMILIKAPGWQAMRPIPRRLLLRRAGE
jgi:hypothetical protein